MPPSNTPATSFTLRWDDSMGCYRVSIPNLDGPIEVVPLAAVIEALENAYHPQNPLADHPADFIRREFAC